MPHLPPLRVSLAILVMVAVAAGLLFVLLLGLRRRRHPPRGIRVDLVSGEAERAEPPGGS